VLEAVFSQQSMPRLYNEEQLRLLGSLETAVTKESEVGVRWPPAWVLVENRQLEIHSCETVTGQQGCEQGS
jgi:hypothetical protein